MRNKFSLRVAATLCATTLVLTACGSADSLSGTNDDSSRLVVGSQDYYSNEILAELYAQALEKEGFEVQREYRIGQREVYMPEIQSGAIDVFPEYTGNLLQYLDENTSARSADDVYTALSAVMPEGLRVLEMAPATDQDAYVVTKDYAERNSLTTIGDLASVGEVTIGGSSEIQTRPYGPEGLQTLYGVTAQVSPIEDGGGGLTVKALRDGSVQLADIYTADPVMAEGDLVALEDPKGIFLASHVAPIVSQKVDDKAAEAINKVSQALEPSELIEMNRRSVKDKASATTIAAEWLKAEGLA
ncbi:MAG: ABC transporter substrate-binding protein [Propionibacteriaceae bacterium]|nr:ABC transporter substrate-binding protein [Propionibacteriaceae bacterium]